MIWIIFACSKDDGFYKYNSAPEAFITSHTEETPIEIGSVQEFVAELSDANHDLGDLRAYWLLNDEIICPLLPPDGGGASVCNTTIPDGAEKITVIVEDPQNATGLDEVIFNLVENQAPYLTYISPTQDKNYHSDQEISFALFAEDNEDILADLDVAWKSNVDGELYLEGDFEEDGYWEAGGYLSEGDHEITASVTDSLGKTASRSQNIKVYPPNVNPSCSIVTPSNGASFAPSETVNFIGNVFDTEDEATNLSVVWISDKDGTIGNTTPAADGQVNLNTSSLSPNQHSIQLVVEDRSGGSCTQSISISITGAPIIQSLEITPNPAYTNTNLQAVVETFDAENDPVSLAYEWHVNTDDVYNTQTPTLNSTYFSKGDNVYVIVTPSDVGSVGVPVTSDAITIQNSPPSAASPVLTPSLVDEEVLCSIQTPSTDPDGDSISYTFSWTVGGQSYGGTTTSWPGDTIPAGVTEIGQTWVCTITPNDGTIDGLSQSTSIVISDHPPADNDEDGHFAEEDGGDDCDDDDGSVYLGAPEICDGQDNDCDGLIDGDDPDSLLEDPLMCATDNDGDGYPEGVDCDDNDPNVYPGSNLEGGTLCVLDTDGDGYGEMNPPSGYDTGSDCNDQEYWINPGLPEFCGDGIDNNCDTFIDDPGTVALLHATNDPVDYTLDFTGTSSAAATPYVSGDGELHVCDGTYYINATLNGNIHVMPHGNVVFDGANMGTVITVDASGDDVHISNIQITQGQGDVDVFFEYDPNGNITNTLLGGGGLACTSLTSLYIDNVLFTNNAGYFGAGLLTFGGCEVHVTNSTFENNHATHSGGAIYGFYTIVHVDNGDFINNTADNTEALKGKGGAISLGLNPTWVTSTDIQNSSFDNNEGYHGSAVVLLHNIQANLNDNVFENNTSVIGTVGLESTNATLHNETLTNNASQFGGGYYIYSGVTTASDIILSSNTTPHGYGGSLFMGEIFSTDTPSQSTWTNLSLTDSIAQKGGGMFISSGTHHFINSTISSNEAEHLNPTTNDPYSFGGGIYVGNSYQDTGVPTAAVIHLTDTLVQGNFSDRASGALIHKSASIHCEATNTGVTAGFLDNTSTHQFALGVIYLTDSGYFSSDLCDMDDGFGFSDNGPHDINIYNGAFNAQFNYDNDATFLCENSGGQYICQ